MCVSGDVAVYVSNLAIGLVTGLNLLDIYISHDHRLIEKWDVLY